MADMEKPHGLEILYCGDVGKRVRTPKTTSVGLPLCGHSLSFALKLSLAKRCGWRSSTSHPQK
jgi:hypothetical protein